MPEMQQVIVTGIVRSWERVGHSTADTDGRRIPPASHTKPISGGPKTRNPRDGDPGDVEAKQWSSIQLPGYVARRWLRTAIAKVLVHNRARTTRSSI
ncbi:hypothetical protein TNCV_5040981 [Trichonephila clavipes]|nr:hypothetical protein TNCV_5040981 [Trichonephila clavipes]